MIFRKKDGYRTKLGWKVHFAKSAVRRWWSKVRWGILIDLEHSMLPSLGRGKYVDVVRRGQCIEIRDHHDPAKPFTIRLIPYQPNHGVMVEYVYPDGRTGWRTHCDAKQFCKIGAGMQEGAVPRAETEEVHEEGTRAATHLYRRTKKGWM